MCYIFFATDDVIVTSVNTYMSMMGISTEDKYLNKCLRWNKKYGAKWLLKLFPNKNWSLHALKALIEKNWQHRYCMDNARSSSTTAKYVKQQYLCCQFFFISTLSPPRLQFLLENIQAIALLHILIFWQRFDHVLIFSVIPITGV